MLDLAAFLAAIDADAPSGPDLEYDPEFTALELANAPGEERVIGDAVIPAEDPDFAEVTRAARALLERSRDLRVAVILANATLRTDGLTGFETVLGYIRHGLEAHWDSVHPQLDAEDDDDPTMRVNAVLGLTDRDTVLAALRAAALAESRAFGHVSLRDVKIAEGELPAPPEGEALSPQSIEAAFMDSDPEALAARAAAAETSLAHVRAISETFDARIGSDGPDLEPLERVLREIVRRLSEHVAAPADAEEEDTTEAETGDGVEHAPHFPAPGAAPTASAPGAIASPEDVKRAIDRIIDYYTRTEPSSPVPLLLTRARRLVSADFLSIMKDMAPLGVENVALIGGLEESDDE
ncbi:type VI secretion system protein TssA [Salipiger bermudensis]|uniref:type VI secretion system protein TssA n=1 Tax=Salipiger bermudensis TaxID=344736 RepID=UPI001C991178|nr:type VI secretion system protein TssA [Salipiger bermudensis]MBY6003068.1 type VI secretion system protein TssA [Salipiger bermudensis]